MVSIINVALYFSVFVVWWRNASLHLSAKIVPLLYFIVSLCCCINAFSDSKKWDLTLIPFLYLWLCYMLMLYPLRKLSPDNNSIDLFIENERRLKYIVYAYIVFASFNLIGNFQEAIDAIKSGDWLGIREMLYWGEEKQYTFWERLYKNGNKFLHPAALVYFFYYLGQNKKKRNSLLLYVCGFLSIFTPIIGSITSAARGTLFFHVISIFILYSIFSRTYSKKLQLVIKGIFSTILFFILLLVIAITISRFGDDEGGSSVLLYFGHSMNSFNYGIFDTIKRYGYGRWFLGDYFSIFSSITVDKSTDIAYGTHVGTSFITLVGCLFVDFGFWGTLALLIIIALYSKSIVKRASFSYIYLYFVVIDLLINGVFVLGKTYGLIFTIKLLIYRYLKK